MRMDEDPKNGELEEGNIRSDCKISLLFAFASDLKVHI